MMPKVGHTGVLTPEQFRSCLAGAHTCHVEFLDFFFLMSELSST